MANWDHDDQGRGGPRERSAVNERDGRSGRSWRDINEQAGPAGRFGGETGRPEFGRSERGDDSLRAHRGADAGTWGQPDLDLQSGQGGYGPLNRGLDFNQDNGDFRPAGFDANAYASSPRRGQPTGGEVRHDPHHASYHHWRDTQLSAHDRDYARWRDEQVRRYDEDYGSWRNERHSAFSQEFEGWRAGRGGQAGAPASAQTASSSGAVASSSVVNPSEASVYGQTAPKAPAPGTGSAHGANPTLARIAEGDDGRHHDKTEKSEADRDAPHH